MMPAVATEVRLVQYDSFRLQVWRSSRHDRIQWSARLEGLQDGWHIQFSSPDALLCHLRSLLDPDQPADPHAPGHVETEAP
jgi:hypothetical protein